MGRNWTLCVRISRKKESAILLFISIALFIAFPPWTIFTKCKTESNLSKKDEYISLMPVITTKATKVYHYFMNIYRHRAYKNDDMIKLMLGEEKGQLFINNYRTDKGCIDKNCLHKMRMKYLIPNANTCRSFTGKSLLLMVYSATWNFKQREVVRRTWGTENLFTRIDTVTRFILGSTPSVSVQTDIAKESSKYRDIIQADFHDSYRNLSLKGRSFVQWVSDHCLNITYVIKADDDQYLDILQVVRILLEYPLPNTFIFGRIKKGVIRRGSPRKKTNVKDDIFPGQERYPTFFHGATYIMSGDVAKSMHDVSRRTPIFNLDDVYMTGILVGQIKGVTYFTYATKSDKGSFQPTYPNLNKRIAEIEIVKSTWCNHITYSIKQTSGVLDFRNIEEALEKGNCTNQTVHQVDDRDTDD